MASTKKHDLLPDFLIIGAGKSGTTSLDKYLHQHPQIFIPDKKEPNFYGYENVTIESFKGNQEEIDHFNTSVTKLDKYLDLFKNARPGQLKGETSNTYMYHEHAPERIYQYNPDMKLIAILRQPAQRLYSRFLHLARENRLPTPQFSDCLDKNSIWWRRNDLIREGFYYRNLAPYYKIFPHENIRVYLYEALNNDPENVLRDIYTFLGVDPDFKADLSARYNQSGFVKNKFLDKIYGSHGVLNKTVKAILPRKAFDSLKNNTVLQRVLNNARGKNLVRPAMDPQVFNTLTREIYGDDIRNLQALIGKDLSHWLSAKTKAKA